MAQSFCFDVTLRPMFRHSLFRQLVIPFVLLVSTLVGLTAWNAFNSGKRTAEQLSTNLLKNVLTGTENATREWLISGQTLVDSVASAVARDALPFEDSAELERYLFSLVTASRPGSYIYIGYADGRYVGVSNNEDGSITALVQNQEDPIRRAYSITKPGERSRPIEARTAAYDARTRPWYKLAAPSETALWTPVYSSASRRVPEVSYAAPIRDRSGKLLGVVCTDVTLSYLSSFLAKQALPETGVAYLTDNKGFLLATSRKSVPLISEKNERLRAADSSEMLIRESAKALSLGEDAQNIPTESIIVASSVIPPFRAATSPLNAGKVEYSWAVTVAADEKEFVGHTASNLSKVAALGVLSVLGAIALGTALVRHLVGDIRHVKQLAERIGAGDLSPSPVLNRTDELGSLSQSLETMRAQLSESQIKLMEHAHELEERVEARTRELTQRNTELQNEVAARNRAQSVAHTLSLAVSEGEAAVYIVDQSGLITYANSGAARLSGVSQTALIGRKYSTLYASAFAAERRHALDDALTGHRRWTGIVSRARDTGKSASGAYLAEVVLNPITNEKGEKSVVCVESDVTQRELDAARLRKDVTTDPLTGLGTRRAFDQRVAELKSRPRGVHGTHAPFSILFMDLDGFKPINDLFGHDAGDEALRTIAKRIQATLRREDTAFRFGGDEFVVLSPGAGAETLAHRICERMTDLLRVKEKMVRVGISIGIANFPEHETDIDQLLKLADRAMYVSKNTGRGGVTVVNS
jgi:diguanylate cyclase